MCHRGTFRSGVLAGLLMARLAPGQADLPVFHSGPWGFTTAPDGWTFSGLGPDYAGPDGHGLDGVDGGAAKFDDSGDFISVQFDGPPASVAYWIRGYTVLSGAVFRVEQSADGSDWSTLHTWTNLPADAAWTSHFPSLEARHLRWTYAEKITGNVGLDGVAVRAWSEPGLGSVTATGGLLRAAISDGSLGRTYRLEQADALIHPTAVDWQNVEEKQGADGLLEWTLPLPTNRLRFYRVRDVTVGMPLP